MNLQSIKSQFPIRKVIRITGWIATITLFFVILGSSIADIYSKEFNNLYIKIDHERGLYFIDEADVQRSIQGNIDSELGGMQVKEVDLTGIEELLEMNPFIEKAEVFSSTKGVLHVEIRQREPLFRIVNNSGVSYYFDVNGVKIPTSSKFTARVVVVTGNVENIGDSTVLPRLMNLCSFISKDEFWKAQFEQIYVTKGGEFELVPKLGNHIILFGKADDLEGSFHKLRIFYNEVLKNFNADDYRVINLKFKDQIVCTKNTL